jgi:outer membrane protein assembly factor BamB
MKFRLHPETDATPMGQGNMTKRLIKTALVLVTGLSLAACSSISGKDEILPGEREPIRANEVLAGVVQAEVNGSADIRLPSARSYSSWSHRGSGIDHVQDHATLSENITASWSVSIGAGNDRRHRITAEPVADRGRIFTLDSAGTVSAINPAGEILWQANVAPSDDASDASGGGLAVDGDTLYVASSFGSLIALDVETGTQRWKQKLNAAGVTAPTVAGGIVYLVGGDSRAWAINSSTGRINWTLSGVPAEQSLAGGSSPAVGRSLAIFPFANGDVQAVFRRGGFNRWNASVSGKREGFAISQISEIASDPVINGGRVYVGNFSGRIAAFNGTTGSRVWTSEQGAIGTIIPVGRNDLFTISDQNQLMRLSAKDGSVIWSKQLPHFLNENEKRRSDVVAHYGPVLAGGRLIVASSDGLLRQFSVTDGAALASVSVAGGAASNPIVVDEVLYVVTAKGQLAAFR